MTWIVGTSSPVGWAFLVSDIRVTFDARSSKPTCCDCLQKIYPIAPNVLAGFAGSVEIGFKMLVRLRLELAKAPENTLYGVNGIANTWWPRLARHIFEEAEDTEQTARCQLILASAHPNINLGDSPWPKTYIHTFSSPDFEPRVAEPLKVLAIGSGAAVPVCMDAVKTSVSDPNFLQGAIGDSSGLGMILAHDVEKVVAKSQLRGVSDLFQVGMVTRGSMKVYNHEYSKLASDGTETEIKFPRIADSYADFKQLCATRSQNPAGALG